MKLHPIVLFHKLSALLLAFLIPLGIWGVAGLALIDSALIPIPGGLDGVLTVYVKANHSLFFVYSLVGAAAAAIGSLVPFFIGRAGGELLLMKHIDRKRYEQLRDRFERQEFLAILIPSMGPPPTPLKVIQFAAGVFEMKPLPFVLATFLGKLVQFVTWSLLLIWFGPTIVHTYKHLLHGHRRVILSIAAAAILALAFYIVRKIFDRRKGIPLPNE